MTEVVRSVDVRAFPMEIAKQMLTLSASLNMKRGLVGFAEAELQVRLMLEVLTTYHRVTWPDRLKDSLFSRHQASIVRFIQLKEYSPMLRSAIARQLLDHIHYFPEIEPREFEIVLGEDELHDACSQES